MIAGHNKESMNSGLENLFFSFRREGVSYALNRDLTPYHTYPKEAGSAKILIEINNPDTDTVEMWNRIAEISQTTGLPVVVFGGFTNTYITEEGFNGILIVYKYKRNQGQIDIDPRSGIIMAPGAISLAKTVKLASDHGLDLSPFAGIPGTLASAVVGNSGCSDTLENIGDFVFAVGTYDLLEKERQWFDPSTPSFFQQRSSLLKLLYNFPPTRYVIRSVALRAPRIGRAEAIERIRTRMQERLSKNKEASGTSGSFWVNAQFTLPRYLIRELIKDAGLTDPFVENGAVSYTPTYQFLRIEKDLGVQDKHVAALLAITQQTLIERYGVRPRAETVILGEKGMMSVNEFIRLHVDEEYLNEDATYPGPGYWQSARLPTLPFPLH